MTAVQAGRLTEGLYDAFSESSANWTFEAGRPASCVFYTEEAALCFAPDEAGCPGRPWLRLSGRVLSLYGVADGQADFKKSDAPLLICDYDFSQDELVSLVRAGLFTKGFSKKLSRLAEVFPGPYSFPVRVKTLSAPGMLFCELEDGGHIRADRSTSSIAFGEHFDQAFGIREKFPDPIPAPLPDFAPDIEFLEDEAVHLDALFGAEPAEPAVCAAEPAEAGVPDNWFSDMLPEQPSVRQSSAPAFDADEDEEEIDAASTAALIYARRQPASSEPASSEPASSEPASSEPASSEPASSVKPEAPQITHVSLPKTPHSRTAMRSNVPWASTPKRSYPHPIDPSSVTDLLGEIDKEPDL